jgi:AraC-like DNA-binding protein
MIEQQMQSLDLSMLPVNETTITLGSRLLVLDNLHLPRPAEATEIMLNFKNRFPRKLLMNCMIVVVSGTVRFSVNFRDYEVTAGMCGVIMSGTIVERLDIDDDARVILLSFSHYELPNMMKYQQHNVHRLYALQVVRVNFLPLQMDMLMSTYRMLRTILTDPSFESMREETAFSCVNLMISYIENAASNQVAVTVKSSRKDEIVAMFLKSVNEHYRKRRDLGFYAEQLCLSLKYMSHVVYEHTGRHPTQWIKDYVILDAKAMLRSGHYTVQQVSDELNFPNQSFFGKYFKEAVGISPKKWK